MARPRYSLSDKIEVREAPGKGRGVFAKSKVVRGEILEVSPVVLLPRRDAEAIQDTLLGHYVFQTDSGDRLVVALGYSSLYNHARRPNAAFDVTAHCIKITARHAIPAGVEITVAYGWTASEWARVGGRATE